MILTVESRDLLPGDVLYLPDIEHDAVWVTAVYPDDEGTWVAYSDGDEGYQYGRVRVVREQD